jgi:hypothetical protein
VKVAAEERARGLRRSGDGPVHPGGPDRACGWALRLRDADGDPANLWDPSGLAPCDTYVRGCLDEVRVVGVRSNWWEQKPDASRHWARTPRFTDEYPLEDVELSLQTPKLDRPVLPRGPTGAESYAVLTAVGKDPWLELIAPCPKRGATLNKIGFRGFVAGIVTFALTRNPAASVGGAVALAGDRGLDALENGGFECR